jgi:hypothetical protein
MRKSMVIRHGSNPKCVALLPNPAQSIQGARLDKRFRQPAKCNPAVNGIRQFHEIPLFRVRLRTQFGNVPRFPLNC